jgi:PAS domain S-box-containing protein
VDRLPSTSPGERTGGNTAPLASGPGELSALIRAQDWAATPLGSTETWPESLRSTLGLCLDAAFPIAIYWGRELRLLYNDAWRPILGDKHPWALGRPAQEVWPEIWDEIKPVFERVFATGVAVFNGESLLAMHRYGYVEECYFDYTLNPIRREAAVAGILNVVIETTDRVVNARRAGVQRDFVARLSGTRSIDEVIASAAASLTRSSMDVPFALFYRVNRSAGTATLMQTVRLENQTAASPQEIVLGAEAAWPLAQALGSGQSRKVGDLQARFGTLPGGHWPEAPREALVVPVCAPGHAMPPVLLVAGVSPRRALDADYLAFFESLAAQMGSAIVAAQAFESERRRAEAQEALRSSEARYRHVLGLMPAAVYTCEAPSGAISFFNEHAVELWGRTPAIGDTDERFCGSLRLWRADGTKLPHRETPMAVALRDGRSFRNEEVVIERPDATRITVLVNIDPLRDAQGRITGAINVFHDVSERKRAEERLRRSEQELSDFFETAAVGLHWVGPDGIIQRANRAELELLGYARHEYVGRHIADFHVERDVIEDILARLTRGERLHDYPAQMRCKDGSIRDVLISSSVLFEDGEFVHTRCFTLDVTARKCAEATLQVRARQQQAIASLGELALRERDLQQVFEHATAVAARTLEVEYCKVLELLPDGSEVLLRAGVGWQEGLVGAARVSTGRDSQAGYTLFADSPVIVADLLEEQRFSGPPLLFDHGVVSGMSCIIRGPEGTPWGVLGIHSTRRIDFTQDDVSFLTAVANVLAHAIQRDRAEAALRESDRRKDEFIAMLSHELRNPLAPLRSALELMRLKGPDTPAGVHAIMERQVRHLVRLVDDLLEMSRISRDVLELRREPMRLEDAVRSAVEASDPLIREAGHRLEVELPQEPLWLEGDPVRLAQVFGNLLNNAARYTPAGGHIRLEAARDAHGCVRVCVRDSGAGLSPETRARLFEMFSRGEGSTGLGIGLALVRRLVEMHGGSVGAVSEGAGRGSEFIVTLPLGAAPEASLDPAPQPGSCGHSRVLVADDNRDAAESLALLLRALGNEVSLAYDGEQAVEIARAFQPHVVLLDIGMPKLDGYEAARRIRRDLSREIKIVALTGWGQDEDRRRAREAGFDGHLVKPADLDSLRAVLT